jgi:hypothetical protein
LARHVDALKRLIQDQKVGLTHQGAGQQNTLRVTTSPAWTASAASTSTSRRPSCLAMPSASISNPFENAWVTRRRPHPAYKPRIDQPLRPAPTAPRS